MVDSRTKTGIQGLDKALNGGIPQGNLVLVSGGAGTGKSTLCLQFLVNGANTFGERGLYISTEQSKEELVKHASGFGWHIEGLIERNLLRIKYFDITHGDDFLSQIGKIVKEFSPKRIIVDSMTTLTDSLLVSGITDREGFTMVQIAENVSPVPKTERVLAKAVLYKLILELKKYKVTSLLTSELPEETRSLSADGLSEFITDGVLLLSYLGAGSTVFRNIRVRKMRYTDHEKASLVYDIGDAGIDISKEQDLSL